MEKDKLKELMGLVLAIETQNYAQYLTFYSDDYPEYKAYFLSDAPSYYCDENYLTVAGLSDLENCLKQLDPQKCGTKEVRFFRCSCDMEGLTISLTGRHRIRFDQCTFAGCHKPLSYSVWEEDWTNNKKIVLENCKLVLVDDCEFINFDAPIFGLKGCERATFSNSNFRNCIRQSKLSCFWDYAPCIFEGSEKIQMTIDACSFVQCGGKDKENIYASGVIANCPAYIRSSSFEDCYHVHSVSSGMYCEDPGRDQYLFTGGFDIDNNRKNSSRLVPKD